MTAVSIEWILALSGVGALILLPSVYVGTRQWRRIRRRRARQRLLESISIELVSNVLVPDASGGGIHLDSVLLTPRGVLVVDWREMSGNVFGSDAMSEWTVMDGQRRYTFANPQAQLYDRIAAVKAVAGDIPVEGRVVFAERARFPKGLPRLTWRESDLSPDVLLGDPRHAEQVVTPWREQWERLRATLSPSSFATR